jgi:hypothetical protein
MRPGQAMRRVEVKIFKLGCWILNWMAEAAGKVKSHLDKGGFFFAL